MHGFNRPLGPIGSNVVAPLQTTSSGMMVTANKLVPGLLDRYLARNDSEWSNLKATKKSMQELRDRL